MTAGPVVAGAGMILLGRVDAGASYAADILPAIVVFGLGLAALVAPLTATVLDSVDEGQAGIASGINNGVSRVAGLLAIAVLGAAVAARFDAKLMAALPAPGLSAAARSAIDRAERRPLDASPPVAGLAAPEARALAAGATSASEAAFRLGAGLAGGLLIAGGVASAVGIRNPRRARGLPAVPSLATAGDCGHVAAGEGAGDDVV